MSARTVFFIGGGNMAGAIIGGLDRTKWSPVVCEVSLLLHPRLFLIIFLFAFF